ncbi:hypothetical protein L917_09911 [Phytophthora nicotianae]|uniref:Uncharacterized protein n=1 Tax=Phytophthora nicotianae TaxID=4792 RepID=W2L4H8_PHYNI|nr:hypothetical protein L915_10079 [Phytophthora nicotianae]ETL38440.1 hypothetical protein L916_09986 [Phytophthora nicotianae]ETL91555.1 hypothetical protein L917_09911 [Phytophthora nicotianae]
MVIDMPPPPPPPPGTMPPGPPPPMPPQLQAMMRQMQQRQPKFQQMQAEHQGGRRGGRGGRGRGRGRGGFQQNYRQNRSHNRQHSQFKRKRGPIDDVRDVSRFFLPSFLEDPWKELETANGPAAAKEQHVDRQREEMRPRQVRYATDNGPGRVFFQPSFLEDPWAQLVR